MNHLSPSYNITPESTDSSAAETEDSLPATSSQPLLPDYSTAVAEESNEPSSITLSTGPPSSFCLEGQTQITGDSSDEADGETSTFSNYMMLTVVAVCYLFVSFGPDLVQLLGSSSQKPPTVSITR